MAQFLLTTAARTATGWLAGAALRQISTLFEPDRFGARASDLSIQTSTEGAPVPIVYGRMRLSGQLIWAARFNESAITRSETGGKGGGPKSTQYRYSVSIAVGLCEGEIGGIGRVWADGALLDLSSVTYRVHKGARDQAPDPLVEAVEGPGWAPAYRDLAYVVFEDLPLESYGNRIPNLSIEVVGAASGDPAAMERRIQGVCLIPASGEFAYADRAVMRTLSEGVERPENHHTTRAGCDLEAALDDLQARLPHCRSVALVTAWFGDDLRAEQCTIAPKVEDADKQTHPLTWSAAGLSRAQADRVTRTGAGPVYGGTPSDESVIQAIKALKARGFEVTLYPFILMDVPAGNALPDPYGAAEQAAFPWRGRITCDPAPGEPGSPDKTSQAAAQIDAFFGASTASDFTVSDESVSYAGPQEWRFNRFILHHAALAKAAGGVESFIIGSEMRGLTTVRAGAASYPSVSKLAGLAAEARSLLGPGCKLSYAADWSEYSGHDPADGSGDRLFHLDPLWADANIDFIGVDWYAPLSDWRDGEAHLDRSAGAASIYDPDYLAANVEGAEGYAWTYASAADRAAQTRTAITDPVYGEPWIWRYKDLRQWWLNPHHDRIGGVRQAAPTAWTPQSKPIRLVELGCPAIDKGANQPNVFLDPKSAESYAPHFSSGQRDDLIQRRYIEALLGYWDEAAGANPVSSVYGAAMLDLAHSHVWTWDARPFPEFPAREDVWADGPNWRRGHWLTGRAGQSLVGEIAADIAARAGLSDLDVAGADGVLAGFQVHGGARARDVIDRLGAVFGFSVIDQAAGPACAGLKAGRTAAALSQADLAQDDSGAGLALSREPEDSLPAEARIRFHADEGDYRSASASARGLDHLTHGFIDMELPGLADRELASRWAAELLARARAEGEGGRLALPPSLGRLEAGDVITLDDGPQGRSWRLTTSDGAARRRGEITAAGTVAPVIAGPAPHIEAAPAPAPRPMLRVLDLPASPDRPSDRPGFWAAAWADPWPGELALAAGPDAGSLTARGSITAPAWIGALVEDLGPGPEGRFDWASSLLVNLNAGALSSVTARSVQNGANRLALLTQEGWEVVAFVRANLEDNGFWRLTGLLRGLGGTPATGAAAGADVVVLDGAGAVLPVHEHEIGAPLRIEAAPAGKPVDDIAVRVLDARFDAVDRRPLSPAHLRSTWRSGDLVLRWIRRGRMNADAWDYGDIPLDEDREAYSLVLRDGPADVFRADVETPSYTLSPQDRALLFPSGLSDAAFEVAQISERWGAGRWSRADLAPSG